MAKKTEDTDRADVFRRRVGLLCETIEYQANRDERGGVYSFSVKLSHDCLITARGYASDGGPAVAFVGAASLGSALCKLGEAMRDGTLEWRPDKFRK